MRGNGGLIAVIAICVAILTASVVLLSINYGSERSKADDCYSLGGIPVQGDADHGHPVVCLDPSVVLK